MHLILLIASPGMAVAVVMSKTKDQPAFKREQPFVSIGKKVTLLIQEETFIIPA